MFQFPGFPLLRLCIHLRVTGHYSRRVSPFGHLRIKACLRLPVAFRSLPRPSSALGALASTLCSSSLDFLILRPIFAYFGSLNFNLQLALLFSSFTMCGCQDSCWQYSSPSRSSLDLSISLFPGHFISEALGFRVVALLVGRNGLEPSTSRLSGECSNQLS